MNGPGLVLYLRGHHVGVTLAAAAAVSLGCVLVGLRELPVGLSGGVPVGAPLWAYLPIVVGAVLGVSQEGRWRQVDLVAARDLRWWNLTLMTAVLVVAASLVILVATAAGAAGWQGLSPQGGARLGLATARNVLAWSGLCLLGARLLGSGLSWAPAVGAIFVLEWFGRDGNGSPYPWAFSAASPEVVTSWVVALALLLPGLGAVFADSWALRGLAPTRRQVIGPAAEPRQTSAASPGGPDAA